MKIELPMRVIDKSSSTEDSDDATLKKLLRNPDDILEEEVKFVYKPYVVDLRDIGTFGMEDDDHTKIITPFGLFYAQIGYTTFKSIYEASTGFEVKTLQDSFKIKKRQ